MEIRGLRSLHMRIVSRFLAQVGGMLRAFGGCFRVGNKPCLGIRNNHLIFFYVVLERTL